MFAGGTVKHGLRIYKGSEIKLNSNPGSRLTSWTTLNKLVNPLVRLMAVNGINHILNNYLVFLL